MGFPSLFGTLAERLGTGLQNLEGRFNSATYLNRVDNRSFSKIFRIWHKIKQRSAQCVGRNFPLRCSEKVTVRMVNKPGAKIA